MDLGITFAVLPAEADVAACRERYFHYCSTGSYPTFTKSIDGAGHPRLPGRRGGAYELNKDWDNGTGLCIDSGLTNDREGSLFAALGRARHIMRQWAGARIARFPTARHKTKIRRAARTSRNQQQVRDICAQLRLDHRHYILNELEQDIRQFERTPGPFLKALTADGIEGAWPAVRLWRFMRDCLDDKHTPWIGLHCMRDRGRTRVRCRAERCIGIREITPRFLEVMDADRTWFFRP